MFKLDTDGTTIIMHKGNTGTVRGYKHLYCISEESGDMICAAMIKN